MNTVKAMREQVSPRPCGTDEPVYETRPELAMAALLYLLSRFPATRTPAIARAIVAHLRTVADDPRIDPMVRDCARALVGDWEGYALLGEEEPAPGPRLLS